MRMKISPLAPKSFPILPNIDGVICRIARANYKEWDRCDLTYIEFSPHTSIAGVLTQSKCASPEVNICREHLPHGIARAMIVNAGNSNAFTGHKGRAAAEHIIHRISSHLDCATHQVYISSTGVIGVPLPIDKADLGLDRVFDADAANWQAAAETISTTDTFPKGACASVMLGGKTIHISAIIKGSGMIAPDMATMLGYIFTDAAISPQFLQEMLTKANKTSFSCITVDSDTSTSDTVLAFATGKAGNAMLNSFEDDGADAFMAALYAVCLELAHLVVKDGEGASKFIEVNVKGAADNESAHKIALSIANSPLVKTAIAGEDANWGRVVMAVGKAGEPADRDLLSIAFGHHIVAQNGAAVDGFDEAPVAEHLKGDHIEIYVDIGIGNGKSTVWTCDLTHGYIEINADYRS